MASGVICRKILSTLKHANLTSARHTKATVPLPSFQTAHVCCNHSQGVQVLNEPDELYNKIHLELKSHDRAVLDSYTQYLEMAASELDIEIDEIKKFPYIVDKMTVLKSKHIYKKARVQYEMRTHLREVNLLRLTGSTVDTFLEYIQRNLPEGVAMKVSKHRLETLPEYLKPPGQQES